MIFLEEKLHPLLKWPGGKENELNYLRKNHDCFPKAIENFYEPFVGGGACFFAINARQSFINDKCEELISIYQLIKNQDQRFFQIINDLTDEWKRIHEFIFSHKELVEWYENKEDDKILSLSPHRAIKLKLRHMRKLSFPAKDVRDNIECALKSGIYTYMRNVYNKKVLPDYKQAAYYYFLRDYCFSAMFRYNPRGEFNVAYGGISYNDKMPNRNMAYWQSERLVKHLNSAVICNMDFEEFLLKHPPQENDFIFLDPPYDTQFSTYNQSAFTVDDQKRLANYLNECKANWLMLIKETDLILDLYKQHDIIRFDKKYIANFKTRNERDVKHLLISSIGHK